MHPRREGTFSSAGQHDRLDAVADAGDGVPDAAKIFDIQGVADLGAVKSDLADPVVIGNERHPHGEASLTSGRSGPAGER